MECKLFLWPVYSLAALLGHSHKLGSPQHKYRTVGGPHRNTSGGLAGEGVVTWVELRTKLPTIFRALVQFDQIQTRDGNVADRPHRQ